MEESTKVIDNGEEVDVNRKCSHWIHVTSRIPQGSVLGPILLVIFINDLPEVFCCIKLFADDAKLYLPIRNSRDEEILHGKVDSFEIRAEIWNMNFKTKKVNTCGMVLKTHQLYTMKSGQERVSLEQVNSEKDLGVILDKKLLFREHIYTICNSQYKHRNYLKASRILIKI